MVSLSNHATHLLEQKVDIRAIQVLLGVVLSMIGIYRGLVEDALTLA